MTDAEDRPVAAAGPAPDRLGALRVGPSVLVRGARGGPLDGLRLVVKDVIDVAGERTGAGNPDWLAQAPVATHHAAAVERLVAAGATVIGKAITDELAFSLSGTNVHYGTPRNPRAPGRVPGGSSSGPASAVAGGLAELALATDTGGSIRVPASYCGIVGLRPTHGRVPVGGVVPLAPSFDTVGLLALDGATVAVAGAALLGSPAAEGTPSRLVLADDLLATADPPVAEAVAGAAHRLAHDLGAAIERTTVAGEDLGTWAETFRAAQFSEVWTTHGRWIEEARPRLGPGIRARLAAAEASAQQAPPPLPIWRARVRARIADALGPDGLLVLPSAASVAPLVAEPPEEKERVRRQTMRLTCVAGLGGLPALSLPLASVDGLPVGLCLLGGADADEQLLAAARLAETPGDR